MRVGFTGTRRGMSAAQMRQLKTVLTWLSECDPAIYGTRTFHHGAAVGADTEAAGIAHACYFVVEAHPADGKPLARNKRIVSLSDILIAAPRTDAEELRSGTWATVRYARTAGKPVILLSRGSELFV